MGFGRRGTQPTPANDTPEVVADAPPPAPEPAPAADEAPDEAPPDDVSDDVSDSGAAPESVDHAPP